MRNGPARHQTKFVVAQRYRLRDLPGKQSSAARRASGAPRKVDLIKKGDEQVSRCGAAVDDEQVAAFRRGEHAIDFAAVFEIDELSFWMEALQRRILVVAVDGAMFDSAILQILDKIRCEETLSDAAFAVDDEIYLFVHTRER